MRDHVAICFENISRSRTPSAVLLVLAAMLVACAKQAPRDLVEIFSTTVTASGEQPVVVTRALQRGVYLFEARESGIDVRVTIEAAGTAATLEDRPPRHGVVYKVVSLPAPGEIRAS